MSMEATEALKGIVSGRLIVQCPACESESVHKPGETVDCQHGPALCAVCGHIFIVDLDGLPRNLNAAEKLRMRELNEQRGNRGRERQERVVARMIG
jgi:transcription elongation factor Elf1